MTVTVDRSVAPSLRSIENIYLPPIEEHHLKNGVPAYVVNANNQEVLKIELLFDAGRLQESKRAVAATANKMLPEGTQHRSASQIAEEIDFYGASISTDANIDYSTVTLYTLSKHLDALLPLLYEITYEAVFPEKEINTYIQNSKQRLMVNLKKVDFLAQKTFNERLYGLNHPNGYTTSANDYDEIRQDVLQNFHQQYYRQGLNKIFVAGKVSDDVVEKINSFFGDQPFANSSYPGKNGDGDLPSRIYVPKKDAVQSGIRIGKIMVNKLHPDYVPLRVLNTVLGGYFGSRLMQNLREEHGFCYGVHSSIASYLHNAHLYITTEVGDQVTWQAVDEIYKEINRLRNELIPAEELELVKHYMLGAFLADTDGPFNISELVRGLRVYNLDESFFHAMIEKIKTIKAEELQQLAIQYLDTTTMMEVVVGNNGNKSE